MRLGNPSSNEFIEKLNKKNEYIQKSFLEKIKEIFDKNYHKFMSKNLAKPVQIAKPKKKKNLKKKKKRGKKGTERNPFPLPPNPGN